jgi:hypothetical protein
MTSSRGPVCPGVFTLDDASGLCRRSARRLRGPTLTQGSRVHIKATDEISSSWGLVDWFRDQAQRRRSAMAQGCDFAEHGQGYLERRLAAQI